MKTVVIVHHTGEWGGGTKSLMDLCMMLKDRYRIIVCIPSGYPSFSKLIKQSGATVHEISYMIPNINAYSGSPPLLSVVTIKSLLSLMNIKRIGDEILALKPDVVIINTLVVGVISRYLSKHVKVICIDRETLVSKIQILLYRLLLDSHIKEITFLAEYEKQKLRFKKTQSVLFPDCVKLDSLIDKNREEIRKKEGIEKDKYTVLFMGGMAQIKGADVIFEAINNLEEDVMLITAGSIDESKLSRRQMIHDIKYPKIFLYKIKLKKAYLRLKETNRIREFGLRESIDELIVASDVVVFPSTFVHQPRPCIEAGAYSKPVIISDYVETKEFFRDQYNALTFRPGDANDLSKKIQYALYHKKELETIGVNNRNMTELHHDYYKCKEIIRSIIERVCLDED